MKRYYYWVALPLVAAAPAAAADKLAFGPPPAWIVPVEIGKPAKGEAEAPLQSLLADQQLLIEKARVTTYTHIALQVQNAQGLSAGNISLPWRPEFDTVTIHGVRLLRDGNVIDVLAGGQTFSILRREEGLESAMLTGVLTANIQPEGLQVGDVIDVAMSTTSIDSTLGGHVEQILATWNGVQTARAHVSALWPADVPMRLRFGGGLPEAKVQKRNGLNAIDLKMDNVAPQLPPKGAPARFGIGRVVEMTSFGSWADVAATLAPLYARASVVPAKGPLRDEVERIRSSTTDPAKRAEAVLGLVQQRVRYVALVMGAGGLVPASAEQTWARRFGDCKAKTALLLAMLREYGIDAVPVAVHSSNGDGINERLPMTALFDHVLVRSKIGGREYWLDGTKTGDSSLARLSIPNFRHGLEITPAGGKLVAMVAPPLQFPDSDVAIRFDASAGIKVPAPAEIELTTRGDGAIGINAVLTQLSDEARQQTLREMWKSKYDFVDVTSTTSKFDPVAGEMRLTMKGNARMDWSSGFYETDGSSLGMTPYWDRAPGPRSTAPVAVAHPVYSRVRQTIILPKNFTRVPPRPTPDVDTTLAGMRYTRRTTYKDNVFSVISEQRSLVPEVSFAQASADAKPLRELAETIVQLRVPSDYRPTEGDLLNFVSEKLSSAEQFNARGSVLLDAGRYDDALKDFDAAIRLEPKNDVGLANRGITLVWKQDLAGAAKSLDAAEAINPRSAVVQRARGLAAEQKGDDAAAVAAYTRALDLESPSMFASLHRARAYARLGDEERAIADTADILKTDPGLTEARLLRANVFVKRGRPDLAGAEADALLATRSDDGFSEVTAAAILTRIGKRAEAAAAYDRALAIKPSAFIYINRAQQRRKSEAAARMADIEAALKLEPDEPDALAWKAYLLGEQGDWAGAAKILAEVTAKDPDRTAALISRGIALHKLKRPADADKEFKKALAADSSAMTWNNLCWSKATHDVTLEAALADCDRALKIAPNNRAYRDSRAFVLLRLGRVDEAVAEYDRVLAAGAMSSSLIGRSSALAKKGDAVRSKADRAAAEKIEPDIVERYEAYGLTF
jgi:tetratricopeptide (TPR) repeat protein